MSKKFKGMQTPEQQYADQRADTLRQQAASHDQQAVTAETKIGKTAWNRGVVPQEVAAVPRNHRAKANKLRQEADQLADQAKPERRWFQ